MPARPRATASISFGLVAIPVGVYPAITTSAGVSFHLLHKKDGSRLKQQYVCAADGEVVPRSEMTRGYEFAKDRYVAFTDDELKALDQEATHGIEVQEFVPLSSVDPSFFERADYLGPGKGGDKAFALFVKTLEEMRIAAIAQYAARGKDYLVLLRPADGRIVMHQLLHADEVRPIDEVPAADADVKPAELKLARDLVSRLAGESFDPARYQDKVRQRIRDLIARKVEGGEVQTEPEAPRAKVVDLMAALKASLEKGATEKQAPREKPAGRSRKPAEKRPLRKAG
jgi:DNA end-binding protein Ku